MPATVAQVLDLYDQRIRPAPLAGAAGDDRRDGDAVAPGAARRRTSAIAGRRSPACWEPFAEHAYYAFNDAHAVMAFVGAERMDLAQRTIAAMEQQGYWHRTRTR